MSRTLKLMVYAALIEMALVAATIVAWRYGTVPGLPPHDPNARQNLMVLYAPVSLIVVWVYAARRLSPQRQPRISDSHRRYTETTMRVIIAVMVALQGLVAYAEVTGQTLDRALMARGVAAFFGLLLAVQGNATPKLDPPSGEGAPSAAIWTRANLRFGWIMVLMGLALVVCALTLSVPQLFQVMIGALIVGVVIEVGYRRMTRPGRPA